MPSVSIVVCSYNPDDRIFLRVLNALLLLNIENIDCDICLVDNNSSIKLESRLYVKDFISKSKNAKIVIEPNQGLSFARIRGMKETKGEFIVFVDDDNELHPDYIQNIVLQVGTYPFVKVWGASVIHVDYIDTAPNWVKKDFTWLFQERNITQTYFYISKSHYDITPYGSGMVVSRDIMQLYTNLFESSSLTIRDRTGASLMSNGDNQIRYIAVKYGFCVGLLTSLELTHIIPKRRISLYYISRLCYSLGLDSGRSEMEIFGGLEDFIGKKPSLISFIRKCIKIIFNNIIDLRFRSIMVYLAGELGSFNGTIRLGGFKKSFALSLGKFLFNE